MTCDYGVPYQITCNMTVSASSETNSTQVMCSATPEVNGPVAVATLAVRGELKKTHLKSSLKFLNPYLILYIAQIMQIKGPLAMYLRYFNVRYVPRYLTQEKGEGMEISHGPLPLDQLTHLALEFSVRGIDTHSKPWE